VTSRRPPRVATALLDRLGPRDEALAGDLLEAYRSGRAASWYWREVVTAIAVGAWRDLEAEKWLGVQALAIGWCRAPGPPL
jgi:hypothetical protein